MNFLKITVQYNILVKHSGKLTSKAEHRLRDSNQHEETRGHTNN